MQHQRLVFKLIRFPIFKSCKRISGNDLAHHERGQAGGDEEGSLRALSFHRHAHDPELQRGGLGQVLRQRAKISFNIILLNLAFRIIAIFLLIDLFVFSS